MVFPGQGSQTVGMMDAYGDLPEIRQTIEEASSILGQDLGKFSFREWTLAWQPATAGSYELKVKATNRDGQTQPMEPRWNPAGYMRNVVETVRVTAG